MVFKLLKFIMLIIFTVLNSIFSIKFDGIPLWSITLFLLIIFAFLKIILGPILSGSEPIIMVREKAPGYNIPIRDNGKLVNNYFYKTGKPGRWRR